MTSEATFQEEHEEDSSEENTDGAHGWNHDLSHQLHVAAQRV